MDDNRKKALEAALAQIERQFGKGAIRGLAARVLGSTRCSSVPHLARVRRDGARAGRAG